MLTALAYEVSLAHKQQGHWGLAKADYLEAALFAALVSLSRDIAAHTGAPRRRSRGEEDALRLLKTVHAMLGVVALLVRQLRAELAKMAEHWEKLMQGYRAYLPRRLSCADAEPGFLDSG